MARTRQTKPSGVSILKNYLTKHRIAAVLKWRYVARNADEMSDLTGSKTQVNDGIGFGTQLQTGLRRLRRCAAQKVLQQARIVIVFFELLDPMPPE